MVSSILQIYSAHNFVGWWLVANAQLSNSYEFMFDLIWKWLDIGMYDLMSSVEFRSLC